MRKIHSNVPVLFVPEEWTVTEYGFNKERSLPNETVFSVGNGYLGVRGYFEEGVPSGVPCEQSLLINGVYEYHPYRHIWQRPGFPGRYHSIFSQVNALALKVYADGELCTPFESAENYMRRLDLKNGVMNANTISSLPQTSAYIFLYSVSPVKTTCMFSCTASRSLPTKNFRAY